MTSLWIRFGIGGLPALLALAGCGEPKSGDTGAGPNASAQTSAAVTSTPSQAEPAPPPPADLDVAPLQKALACPSDAKSGPCAVLAAVSTCKPWAAVVPSGDGRWIGRGYEVDGKKTTEQVMVLRSRRVPTSEVGPGQLPARVGIGTIDKDEGSPFNEADKAIRALERGDVPPKGNAAVEHLKSMTNWSEAFVTSTVSGQVYGLSHGGLYVWKARNGN
ncbi:MAG: hypothetical protein IPK82_05650 [Polyangiaceae bacterium]|nr:hypothetical protein [Polyangiaceae bacterium]